jgi:hypothetical protein
VWLKIIKFLSNYITQKTSFLINSTKVLSFKGIQLSINHKSSSILPWKIKLLNCAIHYHKTWTVRHCTNRWLTSSYSSYNTHLESHIHPLFNNWSFIRILFFLINNINILTLREILEFQTTSKSVLITPSKSSHS